MARHRTHRTEHTRLCRARDSRDGHLNDAPATVGLPLAAQAGILTIRRDRPPFPSLARHPT